MCHLYTIILLSIHLVLLLDAMSRNKVATLLNNFSKIYYKNEHLSHSYSTFNRQYNLYTHSPTQGVLNRFTLTILTK